MVGRLARETLVATKPCTWEQTIECRGAAPNQPLDKSEPIEHRKVDRFQGASGFESLPDVDPTRLETLRE